MTRFENALLRRPRTRTLLAGTVYAGRRVRCSCCGAAFRRFAPFNGSVNRACWRCGALERHRQVAQLLGLRPGLMPNELRVLHIAPEPPLRRLLLGASPSTYVTADLEDPEVDLKLDLTATALPDDSFDVVVCNHVLEHITDDRAALREIRRILSPGGWALVMTPIVVAKTVEDPSVTDPADRLRLFGQVDHVRRYGWDYVDRLRDAGLAPEVVRLESELPPEVVERHRLENPEGFVEPIFLVR